MKINFIYYSAYGFAQWAQNDWTTGDLSSEACNDISILHNASKVDETKLKCFGRTHGFCNFYGRNLAWPELVKSLPSHKSSGDHLGLICEIIFTS